MDKYLAALVHIQEAGSFEIEAIMAVITMESYLATIREIKAGLLENLSISTTSINIKNQNTTQIQSLKDCLVSLAINSVTFLSKLKNITSESIISSNTQLFEKKNADYGNSFVDFELIGIIVRLNDKINRILNLGEAAPERMQVDEKIEDTINDLYNYCVIGLMYT